ncbi:hypothetical protein [Streptomyces sp. NPDC094032]|uniref:hypothetical protein n=1 Tax=Streptomyces sp. NPDC094032 TaxID=3155308 RepID=UPI003329CBF2
MSPTPKRARPAHRRKASTGDRTRNTKSLRIEASWNHRPDVPVVVRTSDSKHARRVVRELVAKGAYVIVQEHAGWDRWTTVEEIDGPALLAEAAAEQHAVEAAAHARRRARLDAEATEYARRLMMPPATVRPEHRQRARHITGAQR